MYALNFYSPMVADQLRSGRKTATIRLGDKSRKYRKGMIVQVLVIAILNIIGGLVIAGSPELAGTRFSPRQKIFDAVIDKVEVKTLADLSPREIEHDNPEIRRPEEMAGFLGQLYNREVADDELVTVIRFSEIRPPLHAGNSRRGSATEHDRPRKKSHSLDDCPAPAGHQRGQSPAGAPEARPCGS